METFTMSRKEAPRAGLVYAPDHQSAGRHGLAPLGSTIPPPQEALRPRRAAGLLHRGRGRPSPRRLDEDLRQRISALIITAYPGLNDVHLTEKL